MFPLNHDGLARRQPSQSRSRFRYCWSDPGSRNFVDVDRHPEAEQIPHLLIFRTNGMLFFANANRIRSRLRELTKQTDGSLHAILINLEASPEIDVTSLEMLEQLRSELQGWGIVLYFARVADRVRDLFDRSAFTERVGPNRIFPGVDSAVDAFLRDGASSNGTRGEESDLAHG